MDLKDMGTGVKTELPLEFHYMWQLQCSLYSSLLYWAVIYTCIEINIMALLPGRLP